MKKILVLAFIFCFIPYCFALEGLTGKSGYGITVLKGGEPVKFNVEVKGVLKNAVPNEDLIVIEIIDDYFKETGIISGMSGSPVYIDGEMIGAVAYSWGFSKKAIGLVTPYSFMKKMDTPRVSVAGASYKVPVSASGFSSFTLERLKKHAFSNSFEFMPLSASAGGALENNPSNAGLYPGAAVGIDIMRGDMNLTAIGTVTFIEDNKVYALGHELFNIGNAEYPLSSAEIITVFPSYYSSFKIGRSVKEMGAVIKDGPAAVVGELGRKAGMVKCSFDYKDENGQLSSVNVEMADNKMILPYLLNAVLYETIYKREGAVRDSTYNYEFLMKLSGLPPVSLKSSSFSSGIFNSYEFIPPVSFILNNYFKEVKIEEIIVSLERLPDDRILNIMKINTEKDEYETGEEVKGNIITMKRYGGYKNFPFSFKMPDIKGDILQLTAAPGDIQLPDFAPENIRELIDYINSAGSSGQIILYYPDGRVKSRYEDIKLRNIPAKVGIPLSQGTNIISSSDMPVFVKKYLNTEMVVMGAAARQLRIKRPRP